MMFLTPAELIELTDARTRETQKKWLDEKGWVYTVSRLGNVKVLKAYTEKRLGMGEDVQQNESEPDFSHWKAA